MEHSYRFFENNACQYFPCHDKQGDFNCLFCYCPMYSLPNCPGNPEYIESKANPGVKIKACTNCTYPHEPENYDNIMKVLSSQNKAK